MHPDRRSMERHLSTESNGLRRKFFQLDNFRNFQSKIGLIWTDSDKNVRDFVVFWIIAPFMRVVIGQNRLPGLRRLFSPNR